MSTESPTAEISLAFGAVCELTSKLLENLNQTYEDCCDRLQEIGGYTYDDRRELRNLEAAARIMRRVLAEDMKQAYLTIYAAELEAAAMCD